MSGIGIALASITVAADGTGAQGLLVVGVFVVGPLLLVSRSTHRCLRLA